MQLHIAALSGAQTLCLDHNREVVTKVSKEVTGTEVESRERLTNKGSERRSSFALSIKHF